MTDAQQPKPFLTAEWRHLAMLNFKCDPTLLASRIPSGTELDLYQGECYISLVGFMFLSTRVCGLRVPWHQNFEEVNLRFYVRRKAPDGWRRGVVFIRELVPRAAIAWIARTLYQEPYLAVPMRHRITPDTVEYGWRYRGTHHHLQLTLDPDIQNLTPGTAPEFIAEHYWGYTKLRDGRTAEYQVTHPPWQIQSASTTRLECDAAALYGEAFRDVFSPPPASAFLALGSPVTVYQGTSLSA